MICIIEYLQADDALRKLKASSIELLEVMLEETDQSSSQLAHWIISQLDIQNLLGAMHELWQAYSGFNFSLNKEHLRNSVFKAYHVLRRIGDYKNLPVNKLGNYTCVMMLTYLCSALLQTFQRYY